MRAPRSIALIAFALAALVLAATGLRRRPAPARPAPGLLPADSRVEGPAPEGTRLVASARAAAPASASGVTAGALWVRALSAGGEPRAGVRIRFLPDDPGDVPRAPAEGITGEDGRLLLSGLAPGPGLASAVSGPQAVVRIRAGETAACELRFPAGVRVAGRVVDTAGQGVAGASVWMSEGDNCALGSVVATTSGDGSFELPLFFFRRWLGAWGADWGPSRLVSVDPRGAPGGERHVELVLDRPGGTVAGTVLGPGGVPLPGCAVLLGRDDPALEADAAGRTWMRPRGRLVYADDSGAFEAAGLAAGPLLVRARARGLAPAQSTVAVEPAATARVVLSLARGATLEGVVCDPAGQPLADVSVHTLARYRSFDWVAGRTGEDGAYSLRGLAAGPRRVRAERRDVGTAEVEVDLPPGGRARADFVLDPGRVVRGTLRDERGRPLAGWHVEARPAGRPGDWRGTATSAADGGYRITSAPPGPLDLWAFAPDLAPGLPLARADAIDPRPDEPVPLRVDSGRNDARVRGELRGATGPLAGARVLLWSESLGRAVTLNADDEGLFESPALPRDTYRIQVEAAGLSPAWVGEVDLASTPRADLGLLVVRADPAVAPARE